LGSNCLSSTSLSNGYSINCNADVPSFSRRDVEVFGKGENGERKSVAALHERQFQGELDLLISRRTLVDGGTANAESTGSGHLVNWLSI
jgi:hypothetical protein